MSKYRKKPVVIEAFQIGPRTPETKHLKYTGRDSWEVYDHLHETWVKCEVNDWIITGVQGETYPCKPDVFKATYDAVEEVEA